MPPGTAGRKVPPCVPDPGGTGTDGAGGGCVSVVRSVCPRPAADPAVLGVLGVAIAAMAVLVTGRSLPAVGPAPAFLVMWTVMVAAMMLPSALPLVRGTRWGAPGAVVGYVAVWVGAGLVVAAVRTAVTPAASPAGTAMAGTGMDGMAGMAGPSAGAVAVGLLLAAGYQLSPWAGAATRACHGPVPAGGPVRSGLRHGVDCVRATGALAVVMVLAGMSSVGLLLGLTAVMVVQKSGRCGQAVRVGAGLVVAVAAVVLLRRL